MRPLDEIRDRALELNAHFGALVMHRALDGDPIMNAIEDGSTIIHVIEGEPDVSAYNYFLGHKARENGERLVVLHWRTSDE